MAFDKSKEKEHLDKNFLEELKHKIWSTKGSRFNADIRLKIVSKYSNLGNSFLSAYLIIFGLISVYNLSNPNLTNPNLTAFAITALSILSLIFSLVENSNNYILRARDFHDCALELSVLYNELQTFKSYRKDAGPAELMAFVTDLQNRYQLVLERYENHLPIDNKRFRAQHKDFYETTKIQRFITDLKFFVVTKFLYLLMIILPGIVLLYII